MEGLLSSMELGFGLILRELSAVLVSLLPDGLSAQLMLQSLQWETLLSLPVLTSLLAVLFGCRLTHSVRSRLNHTHKKQLAQRLAAQIKMKCQLIDRLYAGRQECAGVETALKNAGREKEPANIPGLAAAYRHLVSVNLSSRKEVSCVIEELRKERSLQLIQAEMAEMRRVLAFLEEVTTSSTSQGAVPTEPGDPAPSPAGPSPRSGPSC